ncbi:hypothetical protein AJ80_07350 [Polytolypa hystricis UAMH7299]|uniref:Chromosome segregation ATPase family protein n=1 Tax=Polytolypa hystricis (strain UAMH7299) TaxID=1447883 RepID=A0A2B7XQX4_POLH7|nr:hypothetical protein AJ80_07350 [Polytolypa hystricis UAMH7299]
MQSPDRDTPRDRELVLKQHRQSFSESSCRAVVPMWDSADPARAPPPLPLNPGGGSPTTRPNASATIQAAAAALAEKSQENTPSSYTTNPMPLKSSPEKSLIKGQYHRRLQSLQNTTNASREFASYLERRSPDKPHRANVFDSENRDKSPTRAGNTTPTRDALRPSSRYLSKPILGENTPPSATMLALQNMQLPIEIDSPTPALNLTSSPKQAPGLDDLSEQIRNITTIATALQQEMAQLSRRSKDNATDLVSLKAATNARDEDIRMSLKELATNLSSKYLDQDPARSTPCLPSSNSGFMLDNKAHEGSPSSRKSYTLPRIPSPNSFAAAMERELTASPGAISTDGSASIALLEKVLREMATKEGQEKLLKIMDEIKARPSEMNTDSSMSKMLEEILNLVKESYGSRALVRSTFPPGMNGDTPQQQELDYEDSGAGPLSRDANPQTPRKLGVNSGMNSPMPIAGNALSEDVLNVLNRVKNSVAEGGGLTNQVKALVRELRGEVLGMGREIARKLEQMEANEERDKDAPSIPRTEEIAEIVDKSLADLRNHMEHVIEESQRQTSSHVSHAALDSQTVYDIVKNALAEVPLPEAPPPQIVGSGLEKDEILEAVQEAWETYKPEIELQNFGLERDEILDCLTEGLKAYQPPKEPTEPAVTYEQVLDAIQHGLENFNPPRIETEPSISRDDIINTVRECLESFEWPVPPAVLEREATASREELLDAIKEGFSTQDHGPKEIHFDHEVIVDAIKDGFATQDQEPKESHFDHEVILDAIKEAFAAQDQAPKEIHIDREEIIEAVKIGVEDISSALNSNNDNSATELVVDQLHDLVSEMKTQFQEYSAANGGDTEQVLDAVKDGLEALRGEIESYVDRASDVTGKDEIIDTVKDGFRLLQSDLEKCIVESSRDTDRTSDTVEMLDAMEKEFEHLRQTMSNLLIRNGVSSDKDEILDAIRDVSDSQNNDNSSEIVTMVKDEFEHLRETLSVAIVRPDSSLQKEELIAALKDCFETLQEEHMQRKDGNESILSNTGELLDAFHDGIDVLRADMEKILNKSVEPSSQDEIIDTLREGLASVKEELERFRIDQREAEETSTVRGRELMLANESAIGDDIQSLKVLVTQLQVKVESIEMQPPPPAPETGPNKEDLIEVLNAVKEVQGAVSEVATREPPEPVRDETTVKKEDLIEVLNALKELEGAVAEVATRELPEPVQDKTTAKKEDTDAIETLLHNMKAQVDELAQSAGSDVALTAERVDLLESMAKETKDLLEGFVAHTETEGPTKTELANLETIVKDIWLAVEDLKGNQPPPEDEAEKVVKEDVRTLEALLFEVKTHLEDMKLPDVETLPTKDEVGAIGLLVTEFREQMDEFKQKIEVENDLTAQAFEARKIEHGGLAEKIEEARALVNDLRQEVKDKLMQGDEGLTDLKTLLEALNDSTGSFATADTLKELADLVTREFERAHGDREAAKIETEERDATFSVKQEESRAAIIVDLGAKIDEKFSEVLTKYEDAQTMVDSKFSAIEERDVQSLETLTSTKALAEDLKLVIAGMGDSVTEACDRMSDDAKTFFTRVDESFLKVDDLRTDVQSQNELVKGEFEKALAATSRLESQIAEANPEILGPIKEILSIVGQHYEHSQKSSEELKMDLSALPLAIPPLLPALPAPPSPVIEPVDPPEPYDDSQVQEKLDTLLGHATDTSKSLAHMDKLEQIQEQFSAAAREVSEMVATQTRLMNEHHESKQKEAQETAIALEKRLAQKEKVEVEVLELSEEKEALLSSVHALKQEKDDLLKQNMQLGKELSALETALRIRREEMQLMEDRAEGLERRIVEGVLDHARSLLISRPTGTQAMNLKRVPSSASTVTRASNATKENSALSSGVGMALKRRTPARRKKGSSHLSSNVGKERRILSLSHVTGNRGLAAGQIPTPGTNGLNNLKRSHSVKSNYPLRKPSWDSRNSIANKENEAFQEEDEDLSGEESETGTERRTSYTGTFDSMSYVTGSTLSMDRTASYGSSTHGLVANEGGSMLEDSETESEAEGSGSETQREEHDDHSAVSVDDSRAESETGETELYDDAEEDSNPGKLVIYGQHSDSGLGTDIPTSASEGGFGSVLSRC